MSWIDSDGRTRSDGPDCTTGPGCCCDGCTHSKNGECIGCCKCVARTMCFKFTPNEGEDTHCRVFSTIQDFEWLSNGTGRYQAVFHFANVDLVVTVALNDASLGSSYEQQCEWIVTVVHRDPFSLIETPVYDASYPITRGRFGCPDIVVNDNDPEDGLTCRTPSFEFNYTTPGNTLIPLGCDGVFTIEPYNLAKVAFVKPENAEPSVLLDVPCRYITQVCTLMLVRFSMDGGETVQELVFLWDIVDQKWYSARNCPATVYSYLELVEDGPDCKIQIDISETNEKFSDPVPITDANLFGNTEIFRVEDGYGNFVAGSCISCMPWERICGNCRCACPVLCYSSDNLENESEFAIYKELAWDSFNSWWGDEEFNIKLAKNDCGDCEVIVPGLYDPIAIDTCGSDVFFQYFAPDLSEWVVGTCKKCSCLEPTGCCGDIPLPRLLYADVSGPSFDGYDGGPVCPCFSVNDIQLSFVPVVLEVSARWIGQKEFTTSQGRFILRVTLECSGSWQAKLDIFAAEDIADNGDDCPCTAEAFQQIGSSIVAFSPTTESCTPFMLEFNFTGDIIIECFECPAGITLTITE